MNFFIFVAISILGFQTQAQTETSSDLNRCARLNTYFENIQSNPSVLVNETASRIFVENFLENLNNCPAPFEDYLKYVSKFVTILNSSPALSNYDYLVQVSESIFQNLPQASPSFPESLDLGFSNFQNVLRENNLFFRIDQSQGHLPFRVFRQKTRAEFFNKNFEIERTGYLTSFEPTLFCKNQPEVHELIHIETLIQNRIEGEMIQMNHFQPRLILDPQERVGLQTYSQLTPQYFEHIIQSLDTSLHSSQNILDEVLIPLQKMSLARSMFTEKIHEYCFLPDSLRSKNFYATEEFFKLTDELTPDEENQTLTSMREKLMLNNAWFLRISYDREKKFFKREAYLLTE